jgi:tail tube protein
MGERVLVKHQAAIETVRGTDLAATRKVYCAGHWVEDVAAVRPDGEERGSFDMHFRAQPGLIASGLPVAGTVTFEDLAWWFQAALKGGVTGALRAVTAYDYIFVPTQSVDDLKSLTWETGDETQAWEAHYGMVNSFTIDAPSGGPLTFAADLILDDWTTTAFTGAISDRVVEDAIAQMGKLAIGAAGAVPSSYMTGRFIGCKFGIENNLARKYFNDGVGGKYTGVGRGKRLFYLEPKFEGNAATITERAFYDTKTPRVARWTVEGSGIAGSTGPVKRTIDIVLSGIWTQYAEAERDTNTIFNARLEGIYDPVLAYTLSATVTNGLVTLP